MTKILNKMRFFKISNQLKFFAFILSTLCFSCFAKEPSLKHYKIPEQNQLEHLTNTSSPNREFLQSLSQTVSDITEASQKAVVFVSTSKTIRGGAQQLQQYEDLFEFFFGVPPNRAPQQPEKRIGAGSGFFIDKSKGYILTNNHVIEGADEITIKSSTSNKTFTAKIVGSDKTTDIAVLKVDDKDFNSKDISQLTLGNSNKIRVGAFAIALGAPFGLEASATFGIISAVNRGTRDITQLGDFIQTDAAINPGNSGGPLLNVKGQVIGINTAIYSKSGAYAGVGFAVPSNLAKKVAESLIAKGYMDRGFIGIHFQALQKEWVTSLKLPKGTEGVIVAQISEDGPAAKAGLKPQDVITSVDGKAIDRNDKLQNIIGLMKPGSKAHITYYRNGKKRNTKITIASYPRQESLAQNSHNKDNIGLKLEPVQKVSKEFIREHKIQSKKGAVITQVKISSDADRSGLRVGDVILSANGSEIQSITKLLNLIRKSKDVVLLYLEREGKFVFTPYRKSKKP